MKKFTKVCLIICAVLACLGIAGCVAGFGMGFKYQNFRSLIRSFPWHWGDYHDDYDFEDYDDFDDDYDDYDDNNYKTGNNYPGNENTTGNKEDWTEGDYKFDGDGIDDIEVDYEFGEIKIEPSNTNEITVNISYRSLWNNYNRTIACRQEGNKLKIEDKVDKKILNLWKNHAKAAYVTISLPKDKYYNGFELDSSAGAIQFNTDIQAGEIDLSVGAGELVSGNDRTLTADQEMSLKVGTGSMQLGAVSAGELDVNCGVGETVLNKVTADNADVECGIGDVTMKMAAAESDYDYNIKCGIGDVKIGSKSYSGLGRTKEIRNNGNRKFDIECGIGTVAVSFQSQE